MDILPALVNNSILSLRVLSNNGYTTVFHPHDEGASIHAHKLFKLIIKGKPLHHSYYDDNGLWCVPFVASENSANKEILIKDQ